jgi:hypothetical protein
VIVEAWDECGGTITITWDTTVTCNYALNYVQTITVTPAPPPSFVSTPNDTTLRVCGCGFLCGGGDGARVHE